MSDDYLVRLYKKGDELEIVALLEGVFNGWPKFDLDCSSVDHWRWKYLEFDPINPVAVSLYKDRIVACDHEQQRWAKINDSLEVISNGCDSAVHPDHRKKGLYTKMNKLKDEVLYSYGVNVTYSVSSNPIIIDITRANPQFPFSLNQYLLINNVENHNFSYNWSTWLKKIGYRVLQSYNQVLGGFRIHTSQDFDIIQIRNFDFRVNDFCETVSPFYRFIMRRDRRYLNWRYCDPRGGKYIVRQAEKDGKVLGYCVLRINRSNPDNLKGYIVDQMALPNRDDVLNALTYDAVEYFYENGVNDVLVWVFDEHPFNKLYERYGFVDVDFKPHLSFKYVLDEMEPRFIDAKPEKLHFHFGDVDWI